MKEKSSPTQMEWLDASADHGESELSSLLITWISVPHSIIFLCSSPVLWSVITSDLLSSLLFNWLSVHYSTLILCSSPVLQSVIALINMASYSRDKFDLMWERKQQSYTSGTVGGFQWLWRITRATAWSTDDRIAVAGNQLEQEAALE